MIGSRLLLLACLLGCGCVCYGASLRGVDPKLRASYEAVDGRFACLDGLKTIPFDRVNDDYCDCFDGSDEPGGAQRLIAAIRAAVEQPHGGGMEAAEMWLPLQAVLRSPQSTPSHPAPRRNGCLPQWQVLLQKRRL